MPAKFKGAMRLCQRNREANGHLPENNRTCTAQNGPHWHQSIWLFYEVVFTMKSQTKS